MPEVVIDVVARVDERSIRDAKKALAQGFEDDKEKLRRARELGEKAGKEEAEAHSKAYAKVKARKIRAGLYESDGFHVEQRGKARWDVTDPSKFHDPHMGIYRTQREALAAIKAGRKDRRRQQAQDLSGTLAKAAERSERKLLQETRRIEYNAKRRKARADAKAFVETSDYHHQARRAGLSSNRAMSAMEDRERVKSAKQYLNYTQATNDALSHQAKLLKGINQSSKRHSQRALPPGKSHSLRGDYDRAQEEFDQALGAFKRSKMRAKDADRLAEAKAKRDKAHAKWEESLKESAEAREKREEKEYEAYWKKQDKKSQAWRDRVNFDYENRDPDDPAFGGTGIRKKKYVRSERASPLAITSGRTALTSGRNTVIDQNGNILSGDSGKSVFDQIADEAQAELDRRKKAGRARKRDITPPDYPGTTAKGRAQAEAKVTKERVKQAKAAKQEAKVGFVTLPNKFPIGLQKLFDKEMSREDADEIVSKARRKEQRKQREAAERAIKANRTNGTRGGSGRGLPDDLITGRVSTASSSGGGIPDKLLSPGKNVLDQYQVVGKADSGIGGQRIPKNLLQSSVVSQETKNFRETLDRIAEQTVASELKNWSDQYLRQYGVRPSKAQYNTAKENFKQGRAADADNGLFRSGGGGGGSRGGGGGGRGHGNGNNPILGQILTDLPFVPRGKAGAAIGSGVLVGLASVADAVVTASQALALLPAVATAGAAAIGTLVIGFHGFGDAINNLGDPKKFAEAVQGLAPAAQQAALSIQALVKGPLGDLKEAVQDKLFEGMGETLWNLTYTTMPTLQKLTTGIAGAFNEMFKQFSGEIMSPEGMIILNSIVDNIVKGFQNLAPAIAPFTHALMQIIDVGTSFLPGFGTNIADAAKSFDGFITKASQSGALKDFMQKGIDAAAALTKTLWHLGQKIYETFGNKSPKDFQAILDSIINTVVGVVKTIESTARMVDNLLEHIRPVAEAFGGWESAIQKAIIAFVAFKLIAGFPALLAGIAAVKTALLGLPTAANTASTGIVAAGGKAGTGFAAKMKGGLMAIGWASLGAIIGDQVSSAILSAIDKKLGSHAGETGIPGSGKWFGNFVLDAQGTIRKTFGVDATFLPGTDKPGPPKIVGSVPKGEDIPDKGYTNFGGSDFASNTWIRPNIPAYPEDGFPVPGIPGDPATDADIRDQLYNSLNPADFDPLGGAAGGMPGMPTGGSVLAGGPVDENSIRQWAQAQFGIPNSFGTGSWENAVHPPDNGLHGSGQAFDFAGTPQQMADLANWVVQNASGSTKELIYSGPGFNTSNEIKNGQFGDAYGPKVNAGHTDHVHWAPGGMPQGGPQLQYGNDGQPFTQPGLGYYDVDDRDVAKAQHEVLNAAKDLRDARMDLWVRQHDGISNQKELLDAEKAVADEEWAFRQSQLDLSEEVKGKWKKVAENARDPFGSALDPDFGISKGLAGIVENITRMIGNMAIAPMVGALRGQQIANGVNPGDAGYGILGMANAGKPPALGPSGIPGQFSNTANGYTPSYAGSPVGTTPGTVMTPYGPMPGPVPTAGATSGGAPMTLMSGHAPMPGAPLGPLGTPMNTGPASVVGRAPGEGNNWQPQNGGQAGITGSLAALASGAAGAAGGAGSMGAAGGAAAAAAQLGIELANRTVAYAGQAAGIGVQGLMETFGMSGSSLSDPQNSWAGRLAAGLAGARPAIGNTAGQQAAPMSAQQKQQDVQKGAQAGQAKGALVHIDNYTQAPDRADQGAAKDIGRQFSKYQSQGGIQ